ncbi:hypothetical protein CAXC1_150033 [Candidatus Xenohaliotis californiensis]|uniref:Multidrug resistance protein MdtA-like barrel-sandwich hybrid domain-containing protein n=1 Tax=Candidatus Xenohaliotis californiensis TaxID=84677 RepID=A0ABP0ERU4_9RICK|nr:hypothetical protein CAXC1_150033 [Candidatus Xenohaliotis californiensis]
MGKISKKYISITISILTTAILSVFITLSFTKNTPEQKTATNIKPIVQTKTFYATMHNTEIIITGTSQSSENIEIKARVSGVVQDIKPVEGKNVQTNTILLTIGDNGLEQIVKDAEVTLEQKEFEYSIASKLLQNNNTSKASYLQAKSILESARSHLELSRINAANNIVKAPFQGTVGKIYVNHGDFVMINTILATITNNNLEFAGYASEKELLEIQVGAETTVKPIYGKSLPCVVKFINPKPMPNSTSHLVEVLCKPDNSQQALFGQLANLVINTGKAKYISIPFSALFLDDSGNPSIKIIEENLIKEIDINIANYENNGNVTIKAPNDKLEVIVYGQSQVKSGDKFS